MADRFGKAFADLNAGARLYRVWVHQAYYGLSAKYKRTALGSLWISGGMVASSLSMAIVFGGIFQQDLKVALPLIMAGIICYSLAVFPLSEGPEAYISNAVIIVNHAYPFNYFIFESVCRAFFLFLHNIVVFYIAVALTGGLNATHWTIIPGLSLVLCSMFVWSNCAAMFAARFRDARFLLPFIGSLMFIVTPIFWPAEMLEGWRVALIHFNPLYGLVEVVRSPLIGKAPPPEAWTLAITSTALGVLAWLMFFPANRRRIPFWV
jgi:ABC-type polysaccharide/polyol phosphate export permease